MVDHLTKEMRSENMRRIKATHTLPERKVCVALSKLKIKYRSHPKGLFGKPDFLLKETKAVLFVHGCFWHCHARCKRSNIPKSNRIYWIPKIKGNVARDKRNQRRLKKEGRRTIILWECQTKKKDRLEQLLIKKINC